MNQNKKIKQKSDIYILNLF